MSGTVLHLPTELRRGASGEAEGVPAPWSPRKKLVWLGLFSAASWMVVLSPLLIWA